MLKNVKFVICCLVFGVFATSFFGCSAKKAEMSAQSRVIQSMDTVMKLTVYAQNADDALNACEEEIYRLNDLLSTGLDSSEIATLNRVGSATLSADGASLVKKSLELYESTEGVFDITVYPLTCLWGFPTKQYRVPTQDELDSVLSVIGADRIQFCESTSEIVLAPGQSIDLGGIAKGYTSQRLMQILTDKGITSALVSLGGNVQCLGTKPDGSDWKIGIQSPYADDESVYAVVQVQNQAVITSGGYERFFKDDKTGKIYRHILDTATGYPVESGLLSASIITADGTLGDGLSTSLYIMGLEKACEYWQSHRDEFELILIDDNGVLYVSEGLRGKVSSVHKINFIQ